MQRRWVTSLLEVMLGLLLLSSAALAQNSQANWGNFRKRTANKTTNNQSNRTSPQGVWGPRNSSGNHGGFGKFGTSTRAPGSRSPVYRNTGNTNPRNTNYGQGGYWRDRDRDGDRDHWRHRHHRHHRWHDDDDRDWRNGRSNGSTPPGWQHGRKTGWGGSDVPPGQAKKQGWQ